MCCTPGINLGPLLFLIYINEFPCFSYLEKAIKNELDCIALYIVHTHAQQKDETKENDEIPFFLMILIYK